MARATRAVLEGATRRLAGNLKRHGVENAAERVHLSNAYGGWAVSVRNGVEGDGPGWSGCSILSNGHVPTGVALDLLGFGSRLLELVRSECHHEAVAATSGERSVEIDDVLALFDADEDKRRAFDFVATDYVAVLAQLDQARAECAELRRQLEAVSS